MKLDSGPYLQYFEDIVELVNNNIIPNLKYLWSQGL